MEDEGALHFLPAPAPTREELAEMLARIQSRVVKWLSREGYMSCTMWSSASTAEELFV